MSESMSRAERVRNANTHEIETDNGACYFVRRPSLADLENAGFSIPLEEVEGSKALKKKIAKKQAEMMADPKKIETMALNLYGEIAIDPLLFDGDGECPADQVTRADVASDALHILGWCMETLGLGEMKEGTQEAARFPADG